MPDSARSQITMPAARPPRAGGRLRQRLAVPALLAAVIAVDQAAKWWAWRHVPGARINPGGDFLTGHTIGRWYADPVAGAVLDLLDFMLVSAAAAVLARRRRRAAVTVCGSLVIGGWGSNLLDRLGLHYLTAPGSARGAVDFITIGGHSWNLADFVIIAATPLFLLAAAFPARRAAARPAARTAARAAGTLARLRAPAAALAGAGLIMSVALGAAHQGGLIRPPHPGIGSRRPGRARVRRAVRPAPHWHRAPAASGMSHEPTARMRPGSGAGRYFT